MPVEPNDRGSSSRRSKEGCFRCRQSRIKCDEVHPSCARCCSRSLNCEWPSTQPMSKKHRNPRTAASCESCRQRKSRCESSSDSTSCVQCMNRGEICHRSRNGQTSTMNMQEESFVDQPAFSQEQITSQISIPVSYTAHQIEPQIDRISFQPDVPQALSVSTIAAGSNVIEVKELVRQYFRSVHHFGYLSFVHEADYWEMEDRGRAPKGLTMLMAAHAVRFGGPIADLSRLEQADKWVAEVEDELIPRVLTEFGVIELMEAVLCQTYDFLNGKYSRGMVMAGMTVRMMTFLRLHELDEWPRQATKPLIGRESLRRLAWSVWYLDATLDGGVFGSSNVHEDAFTIQLPCDDRPFLLHRHVITEPLIPKDPLSSRIENQTSTREPLDLSGHLLRAMCARQALAQAHSRIQRRLFTHDSIVEMGCIAEEKANKLLATLAPDLAYSRALYHIYRDRTPAMVLLHVVRNNCERHTSLLRILVAQHTDESVYDIKQERKALIKNARSLSRILADALDNHVPLDPQIAMHAYNAIEILLFQPIRLAVEHSDPLEIPRQDILDACRPLIQIVRHAGKVCPLVALMYPEAINRMVQMGYIDELRNEDILAVLEKVHCMTNADKEFDWTESFWRYEIFLSRRSRMTTSNDQPQDTQQLANSPEDALLEVPTQGTIGSVTLSPPNIRIGHGLSPNETAQVQSITNTDPISESVSIVELTAPQEVDRESDPLTRIQELFATRGPESSATTPAVYAPMSSFTPSGLDLWAMGSTSGPVAQSGAAVDDFNSMFLGVSDFETSAGSLPYPWR